MEKKLNLYSVMLPNGEKERLLVFAENIDKVVDSVQEYYHAGIGKEYLISCIKKVPVKLEFNILNGSVIDQNGTFFRTDMMKQKWLQIFAESISPDDEDL